MRPFLQYRFGITHVLVKGGIGLSPIPFDESPGNRQSAIQIQRGNHSLTCPGHNRKLTPSAALHLGTGHNETGRQTSRFGGFGTGLSTGQRIIFERQSPFLLRREKGVQFFGNHQPQNPVAKEFQPFVGTLGIGTGMGQCADQQPTVSEDMPQTGFQFVKLSFSERG